MPEYLAPGVYVEEVPSGSKPIQAAGTSTAGMVGMTQRGPVNLPTLVTGMGAFNRTFGGYLDALTYSGGRDALPYAVEGFFANGGARVYVTRVVGPAATESTLALVAGTGVDARPATVAQAMAGDTALLLDDPGALAAGDTLLVVDGVRSELVTVADTAFVARIALGGGLARAHPGGTEVTRQTVAPVAGALTGDLDAGATEIELTDAAGISGGDVLLLADAGGAVAAHEIVTVAGIAGNTLTLAAPLARDHLQASVLNALTANGAPRPTTAAVAASAGTVHLDAEATGIVAGELLRIGTGAEAEHAFVTGLPVEIALAAGLEHSHAAGTALMPAAPVLTVHAMWPGAWGDRLRLTVGRTPLLETTAAALAQGGTNTLTLATAFGLFPGSVIEIGGVAATVAQVAPDTGLVTLAAPLGADVPAGTAVSSVEYALRIERLDDKDKVVESEVFDRLSLAPDHPRAIGKIVGRWDAAAGRPMEAGGSVLVRIENATDEALRRMPLVTDVPRMLAGGADDVANVTDATYIGLAALDPEDRTGIQAMDNRSDISICAVPGRSSVQVQKALIAHCDRMAYRFAVLDTPLGSGLDAARRHRQNFDTTRGAVYYPGLEVPYPLGDPGEKIVIAPSGHVAGIYARTDITRGVHKAPANEVVRGILGLEKVLTRGEQDVLNPIAVNCFRDFRAETRGLRLYGARVATSDPEWKYVNVRRLLLFIENSLDTGLQWAVFEPNAEPLWATVRQSVANFLTTVWRSGALEGTTPEEAFFVNIGYNVTMTQDDIDNGRLICEIGVAPVKPAEFVIVRISQKTREATS